jgi:hypothetical protein
MWQKVAKFKGAEYFRKALYVTVCVGVYVTVCVAAGGADSALWLCGWGEGSAGRGFS